MGLADRLKAYQEEQAAREAAEAEAARRIAREQQLQNSASEQQRLAEERTIRAGILAELSPLLETIDARGQLEELRKIWGVGKVDPEPGTGTNTFRKLGEASIHSSNSQYERCDFIKLGYSYEYPYVAAVASPPIMESDSGGTTSRFSTTDIKEYTIYARRTNDNIAAFSLYGEPKHDVWYIFDPGNHQDSCDQLQETLLNLLTTVEKPADVIARGIRDIKLGNYRLPDGFQPKHWYKRILG